MYMSIGVDERMNLYNDIMTQNGLNAEMTYSPIIREKFYQLVPSNFKYYYLHAIRKTLYWYQGYNPEVHKPAAGIIATGIGNSIIHEISKLIIGGKVFFANKHVEKSNKGKKINQVNSTLNKFIQWNDKYAFQDFIKTFVEYAAAGGTASAVTYINDQRELIVKPYRIDQFFYELDYEDKCVNYTLFNGNYTAKISNGENRSSQEMNYYIVERRYYNEENKPVMKMAVHRQYGNIATGEDFDITRTTEVNWEQIPNNVQKYLKRNFGGVKFGLEQEITTDNGGLGVYILRWTTTNRIPSLKMGESALLNVVGYLLEYEFAESEMVTDMYLGRGKIMLPEQMRNPSEKNNGYYTGYDKMAYTRIPMINANEQKPMSIQFDLRAEQWTQIRNNICEKIASAIGVSGSDLFSFLRDSSGGSKTATQIAAESQKTISYIYEKRSIIENALEPFLKAWKNYNKLEDDIAIKFSSQNMVNKMVTIDEIRMKKEIGQSTFDLFKELYPDLDDEQVNEMVERKFLEQEKVKQMEAKYGSLKTNNGNDKGKGINETEEKTVTDVNETIAEINVNKEGEKT